MEAIFPKGYRPDAEKRGCYDCLHCRGAINWWCRNPEAIEARGTSLPTVGKGCPYWGPARTVDQLSTEERILATIAITSFCFIGGARPEPPEPTRVPPKSPIPSLFLWGSLSAIIIAFAYIMWMAP